MLERAAPEAFAQVVDFRSSGPDRTVVQIPVTIEGVEATRRLTADLEETWGGHATEITVTGGDTLISKPAASRLRSGFWCWCSRRSHRYGSSA